MDVIAAPCQSIPYSGIFNKGYMQNRPELFFFFSHDLKLFPCQNQNCSSISLYYLFSTATNCSRSSSESQTYQLKPFKMKTAMTIQLGQACISICQS